MLLIKPSDLVSEKEAGQTASEPRTFFGTKETDRPGVLADCQQQGYPGSGRLGEGKRGPPLRNAHRPDGRLAIHVFFSLPNLESTFSTSCLVASSLRLPMYTLQSRFHSLKRLEDIMLMAAANGR